VLQPSNGTFLGHPKGLYVLFFTEMWERFSYYGMRAILILYMTNYFLWNQEDASRVYKWYTALVYFTPLLGGYLADRFLGNRRAVIIGAVLMAIGHFLMAFEAYAVFVSALIFLIIGNGFFKPNMSTQVGRLYPANDPRRDGAYTIFYMGINLGAFLSPLVCGTLGEKLGYHWGFSAAGVGMVAGLLIYLAGQRWIIEVSGSEGNARGTSPPEGTAGFVTDAGDRSAYPMLSRAVPWVFVLLAGAAAVAGAWIWITNTGAKADNGRFSLFVAAALSVLAVVLFSTRGRARDRTIAISAVMVFIVAFWFAFEQAGNTLTVWADKFTDRFIFNYGDKPLPAVELPAATQAVTPPAGAIAGYEMPASWFQSVNPLLIVALAPLFSWLWIWLGRRGREPSTPMKMAMGVFLVGMSFVAMVVGAGLENRPSQTSLASVPATIAMRDGALAYKEDSELHAFAAGRLTYDNASRTLHMRGVLPDLERDRILGESSSPEFKSKVKELVEKSVEAADRGTPVEVRVVLPTVPAGFDMRWTTLTDGVRFEDASQSLIATRKLADRDHKLLLLAGADPVLRPALYDIFRQSYAFRVSTLWLFLSYLLATMGELCLSPIGLSMVSKLAPAKFATLLMGLWLCNNFFANFLAGFMGELWGKIPPIEFFGIFVGVTVGLALVLVVVVRVIRRLMHGVH